MLPRTISIITGLVGFVMLAIFIIGLSHSISTGFAGFWGGLPFVVIIALILPMAAYDYCAESVREQNGSKSGN
ncbi:MAG: hypothetical protein F4244_04380 [Gammaproteobacteria bacterium]|nr:hypothetical protein [Gammaproteobacteria bacterium]